MNYWYQFKPRPTHTITATDATATDPARCRDLAAVALRAMIASGNVREAGVAAAEATEALRRGRATSALSALSTCHRDALMSVAESAGKRAFEAAISRGTSKQSAGKALDAVVTVALDCLTITDRRLAARNALTALGIDAKANRGLRALQALLDSRAATDEV